MSNFEEFKKEYLDSRSQDDESQVSSDSLQTIIAKSKFMQNQQLITKAVLSVTVIILSYFYFTIRNSGEASQLVLGMIFALLLRIVLELVSYVWLSRLDFSGAVESFQNKLSRYVSFRKFIHLIATPIIYLAYCYFFVKLLPYFKQAMTGLLYYWVLISGIVALMVLALFIANEIKKEIQLLKRH